MDYNHRKSDRIENVKHSLRVFREVDCRKWRKRFDMDRTLCRKWRVHFPVKEKVQNTTECCTTLRQAFFQRERERENQVIVTKRYLNIPPPPPSNVLSASPANGHSTIENEDNTSDACIWYHDNTVITSLTATFRWVRRWGRTYQSRHCIHLNRVSVEFIVYFWSSIVDLLFSQ